MGPDNARDYHGPLVQGAEHISREKGRMAEGSYPQLGTSAVMCVY